jgi:general secretion pathway protein G
MKPTLPQGIRSNNGFTLLEMLVVLIIIVILAMIAKPNIFEAPIRAKVSRVRADMRTMGAALERYRVDHGAYPTDHTAVRIGITGNDETNKGNKNTGLISLTTPTSYISSLFFDPFHVAGRATFYYGSNIDTANRNEGTSLCFVLVSPGPDKVLDSKLIGKFPDETRLVLYDPTNGTESQGDIFRIGGDFSAGTFTVNESSWNNYDYLHEMLKYNIKLTSETVNQKTIDQNK